MWLVIGLFPHSRDKRHFQFAILIYGVDWASRKLCYTCLNSATSNQNSVSNIEINTTNSVTSNQNNVSNVKIKATLYLIIVQKSINVSKFQL